MNYRTLGRTGLEVSEVGYGAWGIAGAYLRQAEAFNHSPLGQQLLKGRWRVEPTIAWLVRYHGCRQARRVGLAAAQFQLFQACAVRNLLMWLSRRRRQVHV